MDPSEKDRIHDQVKARQKIRADTEVRGEPAIKGDQQS